MNDAFKENIKAFVFDVDNTLIDTNTTFVDMFHSLKELFVEIYGEKKGDEVYDEFYAELHGGKYNHTVDYFDISKDFVSTLADRGGISKENQERVINILVGIYDIVPEVLASARKLLELIYRKGYTVAFWTHSGEEWAILKVKGILEETKIPFEDVFVFSVSLSDSKDFTSLDSAIKTLNLHPEEIVVVGDNIVTDIVAAVESGVKDVVWFKNGTPRGVSYIDEAEKIEGKDVNLRVINGLDQLLELVERS
jgi:FMN phosphatase YigB (HAD superfamily)